MADEAYLALWNPNESGDQYDYYPNSWMHWSLAKSDAGWRWYRYDDDGWDYANQVEASEILDRSDVVFPTWQDAAQGCREYID